LAPIALVGVKHARNESETKLVNFAMANATRRKIINFLANGGKNIEEFGEIAGKSILDFHLKILQQANMIELEEGTIQLSECGRNFLKGKKETTAEEITDLSQAKPVEIVKVRQLLP